MKYLGKKTDGKDIATMEDSGGGGSVAVDGKTINRNSLNQIQTTIGGSYIREDGANKWLNKTLTFVSNDAYSVDGIGEVMEENKPYHIVCNFQGNRLETWNASMYMSLKIAGTVHEVLAVAIGECLGYNCYVYQTHGQLYVLFENCDTKIEFSASDITSGWLANVETETIRPECVPIDGVSITISADGEKLQAQKLSAGAHIEIDNEVINALERKRVELYDYTLTGTPYTISQQEWDSSGEYLKAIDLDINGMVENMTQVDFVCDTSLLTNMAPYLKSETNKLVIYLKTATTSVNANIVKCVYEEEDFS